MQLGVTHAFMISRAQPPDVVAGISAGAIHATVLAEVLKSGENAEDDEARLIKQVEVFTTFLEEELSAPGRLISLLLPDAYQVESRAPLEPLAVPTQSKLEQADRDKSVSSRIELIGLINDLVGIRITIGELTRLARAFLGYRAAGEASSVAAAKRQELRELGQICLICLKSLGPLASVTRHVQVPLVRGMGKQIALRLYGKRPADKTPHRQKPAGKSAADIMYRSRAWDQFLGAMAWVSAVLLNALLWSVLVLVTLWKGAAAGWATLLEWIGRRPSHAPRGSDPKPTGPVPFARSTWISWVVRFVTRALLHERKLDGSLLEPEVLRAQFVRVFDPTYYGVIDEGGLDQAIDLSFSEPRGAADRPLKPKLIEDYLAGATPIHLGLAASNLRTGLLDLLPRNTPVVNALLAATAVVPWFEIQPIQVEGKEEWFVDALNVSREPTQAVMTYLRDKAHPDATKVVIYPVNHLTSENLQVKAESNPFPTWVEVARRANDLKNFRDARLEWRLTSLITKMLPPGKVSFTVAEGSTTRTFLRADIRPIEPDASLKTGVRILEAETDEERRKVLLSAIADGCRATIETALQHSIAFAPGQPRDVDRRMEVSCWDVVTSRLGRSSQVPGATRATGPGLAPVCRNCTYRITHEAKELVRNGHLRGKAGSERLHRDWPLGSWLGEKDPEVQTTAANGNPESTSSLIEDLTEDEPRLGKRYTRPAELNQWPKAHEIAGEMVPGNQRPLVSLLFSGGVFRGVYLVGVVNALKELGIRPDIIAGASVGSVTAVLAADVFARENPLDQSRQMARFASVFLSLDRLILTDAFAGFVRTFTLRAAQSRFSLRDLDHVLRRYDEANTGAVSADLRRVTAGLERLFYVTPFDFYDFAADFRYGRNREVKTRVVERLHKWLARDNALEEILGSEPLAQIMDAYVLQRLSGSGKGDRSDVPFQAFLKEGIYLLATATNLTKGELHLLGDVISHGSAGGVRGAGTPPSLLEGVLASSAFPGIFRPRWSWEVFRGAGNQDQYADGGVMDNLPLDAVAHFIQSVSKEGITKGRPKVRMDGREEDVPHLLFTASLEANPTLLENEQIAEFQSDWGQAMRRTQQLGANRKIESYKAAQRHLRSLYNARPANAATASKTFVPADLEVVDVRPEWLCSTFAFHPMMGFRRQRQAESIAHGCASTLVRFQELARDKATQRWVRGWGLKDEQVAGAGGPGLRPRRDVTLESGGCVFRPNAVCPFSSIALKPLNLKADTSRHLAEIYIACRRVETHQRPPDMANRKPGLQH